MDASPNQFSEMEFELLLAAASQTGRNLQVLTAGTKLPTRVPPDPHHDAHKDADSRKTPRA